MLGKKILPAIILLLLSNTGFIQAQDWDTVVQNAKGQTVYFHAWGGNQSINQYLQWVGKQLQTRYKVQLKHVKITDTAISVNRILSEKRAGLYSNGSVDAIWVNGENFKTLKENDLLHDNFISTLPNNQYLDYENKPLTKDFTLDTDGKEVPWGTAQLVFFYDSATVANAPKSAQELLAWSKAHKGKFTYPKPPEFHGITFVKQILLSLNYHDLAVFQKPVKSVLYKKYTQKVWQYFDQLHPNLWRNGKAFPKNSAALISLLDQGIIDIAISFNPYEAANQVLNGLLAPTIRTYTWDTGSVGNIHFIAIPFNTSSSAGAKVLANFLISPEAQARKANPKYWGDPTVLNQAILPQKESALFNQLEYSQVAPKFLHKTLAEPDPSWVEVLELEWLQRYSQ